MGICGSFSRSSVCFSVSVQDTDLHRVIRSKQRLSEEHVQFCCLSVPWPQVSWRDSLLH